MAGRFAEVKEGLKRGRLTSPLVCPTEDNVFCLTLLHSLGEGELNVFTHYQEKTLRAPTPHGASSVTLRLPRNTPFKIIIQGNSMEKEKRIIIDDIHFQGSPCSGISPSPESATPATPPATPATSPASSPTDHSETGDVCSGITVVVVVLGMIVVVGISSRVLIWKRRQAQRAGHTRGHCSQGGTRGTTLSPPDNNDHAEIPEGIVNVPSRAAVPGVAVEKTCSDVIPAGGDVGKVCGDATEHTPQAEAAMCHTPGGGGGGETQDPNPGPGTSGGTESQGLYSCLGRQGEGWVWGEGPRSGADGGGGGEEGGKLYDHLGGGAGDGDCYSRVRREENQVVVIDGLYSHI
ncbi:uncharacterized protein LOC143301144 isoform X2 [Babylonia areolata]